MHSGIEGETQAAQLLFLPLLKRTPDFAAFAMMDTPAEAVTQFSMVELGQDAAAERRVVDVVKDVDRLGSVRTRADKASSSSIALLMTRPS